MANNTANNHMSGSISTTADTFSFARRVREVRITNHHASQRIWVKMKSSSASAAAALALAAADAAVADADENVVCPAATNGTLVWKSGKALYVAGSIIAETGATTYAASGTDYHA